MTIVLQGRESFFGVIRDGKMIFNDAGRMIQVVWESMPERFPSIELGAFVVMPNHFHAIVIINDSAVGGAEIVPVPEATTGGAGLVPAPRATTRVAPTSSVAPTETAPMLGQIIGAFKSITTHEYIAGVDNHGWAQFYKRLWQRNYYERIIRDEKEMDAAWHYIEANPTNWGEDEESSLNPKAMG